MTTFAGDLGSIRWDDATNAVAEVLSFQLSGVERAMIPDTVKGDDANTYKHGRLEGGSITARVRFDYGDTNGQKAWIDNVLTKMATAITANLITDSGKQIDCSALAQGFEQDNPEGDEIVSGVLTAKVTGAPTVSWA